MSLAPSGTSAGVSGLPQVSGGPGPQPPPATWGLPVFRLASALSQPGLAASLALGKRAAGVLMFHWEGTQSPMRQPGRCGFSCGQEQHWIGTKHWALGPSLSHRLEFSHPHTPLPTGLLPPCLCLPLSLLISGKILPGAREMAGLETQPNPRLSQQGPRRDLQGWAACVRSCNCQVLSLV